ncbi:ferrous iron transport protein A [Acholeplasma vituli]|uniref:Ferrous iron transport protein A n=1 Tax=Paracholeplasma vituli TaxID=69473 RepID=A0ABT2PW44_9MOLU|nr:FeoA family protein [Paracholeplasma vituli]MCU0104524.1 ferrous iron transport protein A [Paracholeplasma vituli]
MPKCDEQKLRLDQLKPGQKGRVLTIDSATKEIKRRLLDMGVTPGVIVEIKRIAPLGDPFDIKIRDYDLCIRKADLAFIEVHPL